MNMSSPLPQQDSEAPAQKDGLNLPGADPWLVIWWRLLITWLLAAMLPKSSTDSVRKEQALGNLEGPVKKVVSFEMSEHLLRCVIAHQQKPKAVYLVLHWVNNISYVYNVCIACLPQQRDFDGLYIIDMNQKAVSDLLLFLWSKLKQAAHRQPGGHQLGCAGCWELKKLHGKGNSGETGGGGGISHTFEKNHFGGRYRLK